MRFFRKWMILIHRYLGIALSLLFVVWFVSGIGMIYAGGMPELTQEMRLARMPALDFSRVRLSAAEAAARAGVSEDPGRAVLLTIMDRPAYRFGRGVTVFADDGNVMEDVGPPQVMAIASRFMNLPEAQLHPVRVLEEADQWTIALRGQMPLHKISVDDAAHTELYVSPRAAEVVLQTTRANRALAWVAAIPHWLYFLPLRRNDGLWQQVVLWTSGLGTLAVLIGLVLAVIQFAPRRPLRLTQIGSYVPYAGWMRWHYITGAFFGVFALTWVFSGLLSIQPGDWASSIGVDAGGIQQAFVGGPLDLSQFPRTDRADWDSALSGLPANEAKEIKEVEFLWIHGAPHYAVRQAEERPLLVTADPLQVRREPFSIESLMYGVSAGAPDARVAESQLLSTYDSYYYGRAPGPPLPVLRLKFDDPESTWVYIDPGMSRVVAAFSRRGRLERWVYHGFHSLDFSFWYQNQSLWEVGVITLSLGGTALSIIGLYIGLRRLQRSVRRA